MKEEDILHRVGRNSKALWAVFGVLSMICIFVYRVSAYIYDTKDLPPRVKQVEKDVDKLKSVPDKIHSLESRTSALELLVVTISAENKQAYQQIKEDLTIIKTEITKSGLAHR
jgi:hypothetical protein